MPIGKKTSEELVVYIIKNFANKTKKELHEETGVSCSTIDRIQSIYKLRKSPTHLHNMGVRAGKASNLARGGDNSACYTPEALAKRAESYKETFRKEEMRVRWGLEQKTKIRLKHGSKQQHDQKWYLSKQGYIIDEQKKIAYYTPDTKRATRLEKVPRGETKGFMRAYYSFAPYEG